MPGDAEVGVGLQAGEKGLPWAMKLIPRDITKGNAAALARLGRLPKTMALACATVWKTGSLRSASCGGPCWLIVAPSLRRAQLWAAS